MEEERKAPEAIIISAVVISHKSWKAVVEQIEAGEPTQALRQLMR